MVRRRRPLLSYMRGRRREKSQDHSHHLLMHHARGQFAAPTAQRTATSMGDDEQFRGVIGLGRVADPPIKGL